MRIAPLAFVALVLVQGSGDTTPAPPDGVRYRPSLLVQVGVSDLDTSIRFYNGLLGFKVTERRDDLKFAHLATNVPGLEIGLSAGAPAAGSGSIVLNISVEDAPAARAALEAKGVKFPRPTVEIPGKVTLAEFSDPDGNRLRFAGPAAKR
jgi:predicted enzyme related to lactoylglutathione lyase